MHNKASLQGAIRFIFHHPAQVNYSCYMNILQLCIDKQLKRPGLLVHSHIITSGFPSNIGVGTKLIIFYTAFGDTRIARQVFDKMPERSVVSWTAMASGYSQNGYNEDALKLVARLFSAGIRPNHVTYLSALKACTSMRLLLVGLQIQGSIQKSRFAENLYVQSALVDFHSKCGKIEDACSLFESMPKRDMVSWNAMIGGFVVQGFAEEAFQIFRWMIKEGITPDCFTFTSVLTGLAQGADLMMIKQIHGLLITQLGSQSPNGLNGSVINAYTKSGDIESAHKVYKSMIKKDIISCTALMTGYARNGNCREDVLILLKEIIQMHRGIDNVLFCSMLDICSNVPSLRLGRQIHTLALKYQPAFDVAMGNALLNMYAKCGEISDAYRAFNEMKDKNVISWTSLIEGYGKHGYGGEAVALYKKMECEEGLKPNNVTFLSLLFACTHAGLTNEGWECFSNMISKYKILPQTKHLSCMVDLLARGGQLEEAYDLLCKMNIHNASPWSAFLGACSLYGNRSLGEVAAMNLICLDPENSVNYVVLAGIYAASGAWEDSCSTRNLMQKRCLRKNAGYSLLQPGEKKIALLPPS